MCDVKGCVVPAGGKTTRNAEFRPNGEGFLRLALVENEQRLTQAVRQIGRALKA